MLELEFIQIVIVELKYTFVNLATILVYCSHGLNIASKHIVKRTKQGTIVEEFKFQQQILNQK